MRMHVHHQQGVAPQTADVEPGARLGDVITLEADERIFRVDDETELDPKATVGTLVDDGPCHVVVASCRRVAATVSYSGLEKKLEVHPSARLRRLRRKAIEAFGIVPADAADLVLRLPDGHEDLDLGAPVNSVLAKGTCSVSVDLVHTVRPQG